MNRKLIAACLISLATFCYPAQAATITVTTTNDSGAGSLRAAISSANGTVVQDTISFNISGTGPFTITPATALPTITNSVVIDGYTQAGSSQNTLASGDNAVIEIVVAGAFSLLTIDTSNSTVRGLSVGGLSFVEAASPKGGHTIQGNFIGVDATGTNSLGAASPGVLISTPNNLVGGTTPAARNIISGHGATGIEMAGPTATGNLIQGNYVGTDRTGTKAIGNHDRAIICNSSAQSNTIGGTVSAARNVVSGNLDRGIVLDGTNEVAMGNYIGVDVTGVNPLGNARSGVEIAGSNNVCGGTAAGAGNVIWNNGVGYPGATTNGVDVHNNTPVFAILGNSIFNNAGLGIDLKMDGLITAGYPTLTVVTNSPAGTVVNGIAPTNGTFRLELFSNPTCDPSGYGEGKTLILSTMVTPLVNSNFTVTVSPAVAPGLFITATANGMSEFSPCQTVMLGGSTNSWTNSVSGRWDNGTNWSLGAAPFIALSANFITNANSKTVTIDNNTAVNASFTMSVSNLTIGAPGVSTNTLLVANAGTTTPLHVLSSCIVTNGGAMALSNSILQVDGLSFGVASFDGPVTFNGGTLIASNAVRTYIGNVGQGSLSVSNATAFLGYPVVAASPGSQGTFSLVDGTAIANQVMEVADDGTATGTVWITRSFLDIEGPSYLGFLGTGLFTASNSTVSFGSIDLASQTGSHATYTSVNTTNILGYLLIAEDGIASVTLIGGEMIETNAPILVGEFGAGLLSVSNTTLLTPGIMLGKFPGSAGQFTFAGGSMVLTNLIATGTVHGVTSTLLVTGGQLTLPDPAILISTSGFSRVTVSNGTLQVKMLTVTPSATAGTLTVAGGNLNIGDLFDCSGGTGTALWLTGGQVTATNQNSTFGQMVMSNGTFLAYDAYVGAGGLGTITMAGGTFETVGSNFGLIIGVYGTGVVWNTGGHLITTNTIIWVGGLTINPGFGSLIASNGTTQASDVFLGKAPTGGAGTFTIAGGVHSVYSNLVLGGVFCTGGTGTVIATGGQLFVTNATHNAVLDVENGTLSVNGGYVQADIIILSNSCAHYVYSSGQIVYGSAFLNPNRDDDGDGIPNGYETSHGLNALDPSNANQDTDGDGMTDLEEYIAGTDPTNSASVFRITSVVRTNNNMRITWTTVGGHTNRVYVDTGATDGSYNDVFGNLSPLIIIPGTGSSTTNYTDVGGATNVPARYYRVRIIP